MREYFKNSSSGILPLSAAEEARLWELNRKAVPAEFENEGRMLKEMLDKEKDGVGKLYERIDWECRDIVKKVGSDKDENRKYRARVAGELVKEIEDLKNKRDRLYDSCLDILEELKERQEAIYKFYREMNAYVGERFNYHNAVSFGVPVFDRVPSLGALQKDKEELTEDERIKKETKEAREKILQTNPVLIIDLSHKGKSNMMIAGGEIMVQKPGKVQFVRVHKNGENLIIYPVGDIMEVTEDDKVVGSERLYKRTLFNDATDMANGDMVGVVLSPGMGIRYDENNVTVSKEFVLEDFSRIPASISCQELFKDDDMDIDHPRNTETKSTKGGHYHWNQNIGRAYSFNAFVEIIDNKGDEDETSQK